ncbi:SGNH/GDSL hydrolase family protein [Arthrobacter sp. CG_A4]|uniref:SGNH/GDSL hydrolase family protein n=1 Tax=Arthrobacter sp. CG_A4 TaxID=3071706 RepID=UPI002E066DE9|nr:acyl-CoA thioesterase-1 [Arthrobacter sp. CG_A4]
MRNASARLRLVAPMIATGILLAGCGPSTDYNPDVCPVQTVRPPPPDGDRTETDPAKLPPCSIVTNPANGREEVVVANIRQTALLIGDSQSEPAVGWPREALTAMGYDVFFAGAGGTGFVAGNDRTGNYPEALQRGDWRLPYGSPPLVVIQGGGNDAAVGASDQQIADNADRLIAALKQRYPGTTLAMIGTLALGADQGGGRRTEVDALLGRVAAHNAIPFVSVGDWMSKYRLGQFAADGVHLSTEGHQELGAVLGEKFRQLGLHAQPPGLGNGQ